MTMEPSRLLELANRIQKSVQVIQSALEKHQLPQPSFEPSYTTKVPDFLSREQDAVLDATSELYDLLLDPLDLLLERSAVSNCENGIVTFN